jgi:phosphoglucosamine mutase
MKQPIRFSADGIRGIAGEWPLTPEGMSLIGSALGTYLLDSCKSPTIMMGRDTRPSGREFVEILKRSISSLGVNVWDLGIAPTPAIAYLVKKHSAKSSVKMGVIISASHNPAKFNGIKLVNSNGLRLQSKEEERILKILSRLKSVKGSRQIIYRNAEHQHLLDEYIQDHIKHLGSHSLSGIRIVIDCSNGAVSRTGKQLLTGLGATVMSRNNCLTGEKKINDKCGSEYYRMYPERLIKIVKQNRASYGFAFDGDGDRIIVVDKKGNFYNGDDLLYVLATHFRSIGKLWMNRVVTTRNSNSGMKESLENYKVDGVNLSIKAIRAKNGDKNLEAKIWAKANKAKGGKIKYKLGAEQVGNIIIDDGKHGAADSLYAISLLCAILHSERKTLRDKTILLEKYPQVSASIHVNLQAPQKEIRRLKKEIEQKSEARVLAWYSSTEPGLFNVMIEGSKTQNIEFISGLAIQFCWDVLHIVQEKPKYLDLSSRKRAG